MDNIFIDLENFCGQKVPECLKFILWKSGYDSVISIKRISEEKITKIEQHIQKKRKVILSQLDDADDTTVIEYKKQEVFEFLPGHRDILLDLPKTINNMQECFRKDNLVNVLESNNVNGIMTEYSVILDEFLKTARRNKDRSKNAHQYDDIVRYFATYIFLLCGRMCYETLNHNLPIPSTKTICKLRANFLLIWTMHQFIHIHIYF